MAGNFYPDWDAAWAAMQKSSADWTADDIAASGEETGDAISQDQKSVTEVSVKAVYNASATAGIIVYVLRDTDGTNYETSADAPFAISMPFAAGGTKYKTFCVYGWCASAFKISVKNLDGSYAVTITVKQRQAIGAYT